MPSMRALIRDHRLLAAALLLLTLGMKAFLPAGYMVAAAPGMVLTISICSEGTGGQKQMQLVVPSKNKDGSHSDGAKKGDQCAFSSLSQAALGGSDAFPLALALAFILVLGLAATRNLTFAKIAHLRPPLRGPPAAR